VSTDAGRAEQRVRVESGSVAGNGAGGVFCETAWTDRSGPAMVLTHDGLLHRETWDAQFRAFADRYRVARWDRRGYGRSPAPRAPYSSVDDLVAVIRSISDGPATLVGCSFGGLSAYAFMCRLAYGLTCRSVRASCSVSSS
jgi:pimeloyl-ACP methyl ester carboxylesterase